jgi:5S rRNA maturation endonuclease (ribonuclease M5)
MHIKFLGHGKGKGSTATNYIMSDIDHTKKKRPISPEILRGNPSITGSLADSLGFKHKYRSAVIAFHPNDKPTVEQLNEVLDSFEKVAFAGLGPDQYDWTAVLHREADSEHIHIIVPRVELSMGKSMNIAPPGWKNTYDPLRDLLNEKHNWVSPDISLNPEISRITQPSVEGTHKSKSAQTRAEIKQSIENYLTDEIQAGNVENRDDIILSLHGLGFETPRIGKDYITILDPETNTRTRLKGAIYEKSWTVERTLERTSNQETSTDRASASGRIRELERELENRIQERAEYNQQRYPHPNPSPEPRFERTPGTSKENKKDTINGVDTATINSPPDLNHYLGEQLGSDAIPIKPYQATVNRDKPKPANTSDYERSSDIKPLRREQEALRPDRREGSGISEWLQDFKNKIGNLYDRARTEINDRLRKIVNSIRNGHESVTESSNDFNEASTSVEQSISESEDIIERGVRKVRENRNDELDRFKTHINLVEYAASRGYEIIKRDSSKNSKAMKHPEGDKIIVATDTDGHGIYFSVSHGDSGSIIDFVQNRQNLNLGETRKELRAFGGFTDVPEYKNYSKPIKSTKDTAQAAYMLAQAVVSNEHPYLLDDRKISLGVLKEPRFNRSVKIDARNNALFPHFNSKGVAGYEIKNKDFTGYAKGGEKGLWYSANITRAKNVVIVESGIDALSHAELKGTGEETAYVSIAGSMSAAQLDLIKTVTEGKQTIIATDNDTAGNKYAEQIKEIITNAEREAANNKDWNDDLQQYHLEREQDYGLEM